MTDDKCPQCKGELVEVAVRAPHDAERRSTIVLHPKPCAWWLRRKGVTQAGIAARRGYVPV